MDRAFGCVAGGIQGLLELPREQWEAIEADLLAAGFVLADIPSRVTWRAVIAQTKLSRPGSALHAVAATDETPWPRIEQLMAVLVDGMNDLAWLYMTAHTEDPPPRPQRYPRPGVQQIEDDRIQHYGSEPIPANEFDAWWNGGGG